MSFDECHTSWCVLLPLPPSSPPLSTPITDTHTHTYTPPHTHTHTGYSVSGTEVRTTQVTYDKAGKLDVICGELSERGREGVRGREREGVTLAGGSSSSTQGKRVARLVQA